MSKPTYDPTQMHRVAQQLQTIIDNAKPTHSLPPDPTSGTWHDLRKAIVQAYQDKAAATAAKGGRAVIMAGPPGAGKSRAVATAREALGHSRADTLGVEGDGFITIDADDIKPILLGIPNPDLDIDPDLLAQARDHWQQVTNTIAPHPLEDGKPVMPGELSTLVHQLSTETAEETRQALLAEHYDVKIEGTLQWLDSRTQGQGPKLVAELQAAKYNSIAIVAVDTPEVLCQQGAFERWADARAAGRPDARYTPPEAISSLFPPGSQSSRCITNARITHQLASEHPRFNNNLLIVHREPGQAPRVQLTTKQGTTHDLTPPASPAKTKQLPTSPGPQTARPQRTLPTKSGHSPGELPRESDSLPKTADPTSTVEPPKSTPEKKQPPLSRRYAPRFQDPTPDNQQQL